MSSLAALPRVDRCGEREVMTRDRKRVALQGRPIAAVILRKIIHRRVRRLFRIAHPYPGEPHALCDRIGAHLCTGWNDLLPRNSDALSAAVEGHAVIAAFDGVALEFSHRQGCETVRTHVFE